MTLTATRLNLAALNDMDRDAFVAAVGPAFENAPGSRRPPGRAGPSPASMRCMAPCSTWFAKRPRSTASPSCAATRNWPAARWAGTMTAESVGEQRSAGLDALSREELGEMQRLNRSYRERHGFPFIIAVRRNTKEQIFEALRMRAAASTEAEHRAALEQIGFITRGRIDALVDG